MLPTRAHASALMLALASALAVACAASDPSPVTPAPVSAPTASARGAASAPPRPPPTPPPAACVDEALADRLRACPSPVPAVSAVDVLEAERRLPPPKTVKRREGGAIDVTPTPLGPEVTAYLAKARAFVCGTRASPTAIELAQADAAEYAIARRYFESSHWEEAAVLFDRIARRSSEAGIYAAVLALESLNVLEAHGGRRACRATMTAWARDYEAQLCGPGRSPEPTCADLARARRELETRGP